jgi:hypothetical protein
MDLGVARVEVVVRKVIYGYLIIVRHKNSKIKIFLLRNSYHCIVFPDI